MKVLVELELNVSDQTGTASADLRDDLERILGAWLHSGNSGVAGVQSGWVRDVTALVPAPIAETARVLLGNAGSRALDHLPDLRAVVCLPLWGMESPQLPVSFTFVRRNDPTDPVALKMALAAQLATVLSQTVAVFPEMVAAAQTAVREAIQRIPPPTETPNVKIPG